MPENSPDLILVQAPSQDQAKALAHRQFAHLRLHTEFSINDGLVTIKPLISRLRELDMPAAAVTDQANMFALIKFYSGASNAGIKPLCGCDLLVADGEQGRLTRLLLLAIDNVGYLNLTNLVSDLYTENQGTGGLVLPKTSLQGRCEGLIGLSGAQHSDIGMALLAGETEIADRLLQHWRHLFADNFYLELQRVGRPEEEQYIEAALALAQRAACPVVATNDVRFIHQKDYEAHEVRVCINERRTLDDPRR